MARTSLASIQESGWSLTVVMERDDISRMAPELIRAEKNLANERMKRAQRLARDEVKKTLSRQMARPSRANEPPRRITGSVMRSVRLGRRVWGTGRYGSRFHRPDALVLTGRIEFKHPAAGPLEFGALKSLGFGPRPYWRITLARIADKLEAILTGAA